MDHWIEQAKMMITECECSEREKRRRVVESLKGPALAIIKAVRMSSPGASTLQYLEALESTFGSSESGEDLYFAFQLLRQCPGGSLSDFLRRMEKSLTKVIQRGGLSPVHVDKARVEQLICGAVESDTMILQFRLRKRKRHPPTFLSLLNEVREAEETEATRHKITAMAKPVHFQDEENICARTQSRNSRTVNSAQRRPFKYLTCFIHDARIQNKATTYKPHRSTRGNKGF